MHVTGGENTRNAGFVFVRFCQNIGSRVQINFEGIGDVFLASQKTGCDQYQLRIYNFLTSLNGNHPDDKIMLDPGVGFGKTYEQNLEAINHVDVLQELGLPILLGTSRKSVIGNTLDLPVDQRVEGTLATTVIGMLRGCSFVRVHDIKENHRIIQMTKAILSC